MSEFPLPKGYQRLGAFPLDATAVFESFAILENYALTNGTAYPGQICSVIGGDVYKINPDMTVSSIKELDLDLGEF